MKAPIYPKKPYPPYKPTPPAEIITEYKELGSIDINKYSNYSLEQLNNLIVDFCTEKNVDVRRVTVRFDSNIEWDYDDASSILTPVILLKQDVPNSAFEFLNKKFLKDKEKYDSDYEKYLVDEKKYKENMKTYNKEYDLYALEQSKAQVTRLEKKLNKPKVK